MDAFERRGYRVTARSDFERRLEAPHALPLRLAMTSEGRIFGGSFGLEVASAEPILPRTRGLSARGRGVVRLRHVAFRARSGDEEGARLAQRLTGDQALQRALGAVHFERIRVEADGRPVIRHMGGSVVWVLFPPVVRPVPLPEEQVGALVAAVEAFVASG